MAKDTGATAQEFFEWIQEARDIVDAHFPNEARTAHNALIVDTARALMMTSKLTAIETAVARLAATYEPKEEA